MEGLLTPDFWRGRRVLLTGHTGFKGAWMALWLELLGAEVTGFALPPETDPSLFEALSPWLKLRSIIGDIRDPEAVTAAVRTADPEIVLHMAAQSLVRRSYENPLETFETNVIGTARLLEALRDVEGLMAVVVLTSDKAYRNLGDGVAYREDAPLSGDDPYSASKVGTEMAAAAWGHSFFLKRGIAVVTARAGNVIGGGDWAMDRLIPDLWRATRAGTSPILRYPQATRPWQHVLDPLAGYLMYTERLIGEDCNGVPRALNFGPSHEQRLTVGELAERFLGSLGAAPKWRRASGDQPPESIALAIDARLARETLGWAPRLDLTTALDWTAAWYHAFDAGEDMRAVSRSQIEAYASPGR